MCSSDNAGYDHDNFGKDDRWSHVALVKPRITALRRGMLSFELLLIVYFTLLGGMHSYLHLPHYYTIKKALHERFYNSFLLGTTCVLTFVCFQLSNAVIFILKMNVDSFLTYFFLSNFMITFFFQVHKLTDFLIFSANAVSWSFPLHI